MVDVCIATYKRPQLLLKLLTSIVISSVNMKLVHTIIVVDNDPSGSGQYAVDEISKKFPFIKLLYFSQPVKNIALTRNMAVHESHADFVAFVDDDEVVSECWLENLISALRNHSADVVFGPVEFSMPASAPSWIGKGKWFKSKRVFKTGTVLQHGATSNVLVRRSALLSLDEVFLDRFGLTGGEDTELFYRMYLTGFKLIFCNDAVVTEEVTETRLTWQWLVKRSFRSGQTYARIFDSRQTLTAYVFTKCKRLLLTLWFLVLLVPSGILGKSVLVDVACRLSSNLGRILYKDLFLYNEYK